MKNIAIILGTRPEAIKLIPVYKKLKNVELFNVSLISTGQHKEMLNQIFEFFEVTPDYEFQLMEKNQRLTELSTRIMTKLSNFFEETSIDAIIVQGDTTTTMVSALTAFYYKIKVVHIEAGLRTYEKYSPFPEEVNRQITSVIADVHFTPTQNASDLLHNEISNRYVEMVGNTVIDSLLFAKYKVESQANVYHNIYKEKLLPYNKMILITGHRRENFGIGFQNICEAISLLAKRYPDISFIYPVHLNPNVKNIIHNKLSKISNIFLIDPVPYDHIVYLMKESYLILTDSGGIQEEAPSFHKPVVILRDTTERPEGIEAGSSILAGTDTDMIVKIVTRLIENQNQYAEMSKGKNPYGDGNSSERIVEILIKYLTGKE